MTASEGTQRTSNNDLAVMVQELSQTLKESIHKNDMDHLKINNKLTHITEQQEANTEQIQENEAALKGNGKEGLNSIVNGMKKSVERMEKLLWLVLSSVIVGVIGAVLATVLK